MAIKIPILTSFDPKGLKQANASFAKLQGSIGSLGRNFAVAGAAIAAAGAVIAKNAQALARIEQINAQTAQTIKSMGDVAGISATQVEALAGSLEKLTATEAESIQEGANLLLTFGNIRDNLGAGNDIFTQTTKIMVDLGVALKRGPVQTATMLGKALNDPIKGLTALTRVGVSFSDQQKEQVKALQQSGDLMGAQKVILAELQKQYGGSGAAYAKTFNGQLALMGHELGTIGEEATMAVMPALQGMVEQLREVLPLIGPQLKAAIESVDWKALVQSVVDFTRFLVENATTIANVVIGIFALNTAYKLMQVAIGISTVATQLKTWYMAQLATGLTATTIATNLFSSALRLIPWVAAAAGAAMLTTQIANSGESLDKYTTYLASSDEKLSDFEITAGAFALRGADIMAEWSPLNAWFRDFLYQLAEIPKDIDINVKLKTSTAYDTAETKRLTEQAFGRGALDMSLGKWETVDPDPKGTGAKAAGKAAGNSFVSGVELAVKANAKKLQEILTKFTAETPIKDDWTQFGSTLGNQIIGGLSKSIEKIGPFIGSKSIKAFKGLYKQAAALQDAFVARTQFQTQLKENIMSMFDFKAVKTGLSGIIKQFKDQVAQTKKFRDNLVELQKLGLSGDLFRKIAEGQDFATASELVKGGAGAVSEINSLYGQLQGFSNEIATVSGNALYNLGVDSATGFVRTLEDGFMSLKSLADLERKKAQVIAAQNSAAALTPFNSGLSPAKIKAIQKKAAEDYQYYLGRSVDPITGQRREGVLRGPLENAQSRGNLDQYFLGGGQMTGNISNQLAYLDLGRNAQIAAERSAKEQARAERAGRSINVNVNGGLSTSAQIGQSVVEAIRAYERSSGQVYASA